MNPKVYKHSRTDDPVMDTRTHTREMDRYPDDEGLMQVLATNIGAVWDGSEGWLLPFYVAGDKHVMVPLRVWLERRREAAEHGGAKWDSLKTYTPIEKHPDESLADAEERFLKEDSDRKARKRRGVRRTLQSQEDAGREDAKDKYEGTTRDRRGGGAGRRSSLERRFFDRRSTDRTLVTEDLLDADIQIGPDVDATVANVEKFESAIAEVGRAAIEDEVDEQAAKNARVMACMDKLEAREREAKKEADQQEIKHGRDEHGAYVEMPLDKSLDILFKGIDLPEEADNWKHRSAKMKCQTCMFYVPKVGPHTGDVATDEPDAVPRDLFAVIGRCRERSPTIKGWPAMYPGDWCGAHKIDQDKL